MRTRAGDDPFAKIKGLIGDMISRLTKQANEEADHKAYCDTERASSVQKREKFSNRVDDLNTRIEEADANIAKLKEEIAILSSEVADMDKNFAEATALRQKEATKAQEAAFDWKVAQEAMSAAIATLQ